MASVMEGSAEHETALKKELQDAKEQVCAHAPGQRDLDLTVNKCGVSSASTSHNHSSCDMLPLHNYAQITLVDLSHCVQAQLVMGSAF